MPTIDWAHPTIQAALLAATIVFAGIIAIAIAGLLAAVVSARIAARAVRESVRLLHEQAALDRDAARLNSEADRVARRGAFLEDRRRELAARALAPAGRFVEELSSHTVAPGAHPYPRLRGGHHEGRAVFEALEELRLIVSSRAAEDAIQRFASSLSHLETWQEWEQLSAEQPDVKPEPLALALKRHSTNERGLREVLRQELGVAGDRESRPTQ
jgi:hypothetical protein